MRYWWLVVLCFIGVGAVAAAYPFGLPSCIAEKQVDTSGKTWQMTGVATNSFADVRDSFYSGIRKAGYRMRHEIPMDKTGERVLVAWVKNDRELILMLWPIAKGRIGFAWGEAGEAKEGEHR